MFPLLVEVLYSSVPFQGHPTEESRKICVPHRCVSAGSKKKCLGSCTEIYFCHAGELFSIYSRSCSEDPLAPPSPLLLLKGESAEAFFHPHFGQRCIRMLLICLLGGKLPPNPAGLLLLGVQISISQEVEKLLQKANFWFILWP